MSVILTASVSAFRENLRLHGESLALGSGAVVLGLVRRDVVGAARRSGLPDFTTKASVSVEIETPSTLPVVGEYLCPVLSPGHRYRITEVLIETPYSVRLNCQPSNVNTLT